MKMHTFKPWRILEPSQKNEADELGEWVCDKLNRVINRREEPLSGEVDKYWNKFEKYIEALQPDNLEETRRSRWQSNRHIIEREIHHFLIHENRTPTQNELVNKTGLSRQTISKHLKEGLNSSIMREELEGYRIMTPKVLNALYKWGISNQDTRALKIFLDYFKEPEFTNIRQQTNYIQVNNTRIDELTIEGLPNDAKSEIESIINRYKAN